MNSFQFVFFLFLTLARPLTRMIECLKGEGTTDLPGLHCQAGSRIRPLPVAMLDSMTISGKMSITGWIRTKILGKENLELRNFGKNTSFFYPIPTPFFSPNRIDVLVQSEPVECAPLSRPRADIHPIVGLHGN